MVEKGPQIRTIGNASQEKKEEVKKEILEDFFNQERLFSDEEIELLGKYECLKSEKQIALINFANEQTSILMREMGVEPYDIPAENLHILRSELFKKFYRGEDKKDIAQHLKQAAVFDAKYFQDNPVFFGSVVFHEILHLKGHFSLEVKEGVNKAKRTPYRQGVSVYASQKRISKDGLHEHFSGLNEAIVSETEKRYFSKMLDLPELAVEKGWLKSEKARALKEKLLEKEFVFHDDIISVGENSLDENQVFSYFQQRNVLAYLCTEIQKQFSNQYKNTDEVYRIFLKAHFTGELLQIARLVEKTFGEGSFRLLGDMSPQKQSGILCLESLKKARARQVRNMK